MFRLVIEFNHASRDIILNMYLSLLFHLKMLLRMPSTTIIARDVADVKTLSAEVTRSIVAI